MEKPAQFGPKSGIFFRWSKSLREGGWGGEKSSFGKCILEVLGISGWFLLEFSAPVL